MVQVIVFHLCIIKPILQPVLTYYQLDPNNQMELKSTYKYFQKMQFEMLFAKILLFSLGVSEFQNLPWSTKIALDNCTVAYFTKKVDPSLVKLPLKFNSSLGNLD